MKAFNRILVAVDESEASRQAVSYVASLLDGKSDAHVSLFHVELPPHMLEWGGSEDAAVEAKVEDERAEAYRNMEKRSMRKGESLFKDLQGMFTKKGANVEGKYIRFEEPLDAATVSKAILDAAGQHDCGTVVVGKRAFSGLKRWFQSPVDEKLVHDSSGITIWLVD